jgi:large conductance mechanosensitive channel
MLTEFREFLEKFNVVPIAVGLVLALAFQPLVDSVVNVILSLIGKAGGLDVNFDNWNPGDIPFGAFLTALISFILLAFIVFMIVKAISRAGARTTLAETPDQALLAEIRDLLKK